MHGTPPPREITEIIEFKAIDTEENDIERFYSKIKEMNETQREKYKKATEESDTLSLGEKVFVRNRQSPSTIEGITKKLVFPNIGPYIINKTSNNNTYKLIDPTNKKMKGTYNQAELKKHHE